MIQVREVPRIDLSALDAELLDADGRMRLLPASKLRGLIPDELAAWTHERSRYGLVTEELICMLRTVALGGAVTSGSADAIEIGAGMGDLGHRLGIHMTDSAIQTTPEHRLYYAKMRQPITDPPPDVERLDAVAAVRRYKPRIVIASWCTQLYKDGDTPQQIGSSVYGIDEEWLLANVDTYVHIGNDGPHAGKRILAAPHICLRTPGLVSRAHDQTLNCVRIWRRGFKVP